MTLCGRCLHAVECHEKHNGHFMFCSACQKLCNIEQFNEQHKPSSEDIIMRIGANRQ